MYWISIHVDGDGASIADYDPPYVEDQIRSWAKAHTKSGEIGFFRRILYSNVKAGTAKLEKRCKAAGYESKKVPGTKDHADAAIIWDVAAMSAHVDAVAIVGADAIYLSILHKLPNRSVIFAPNAPAAKGAYQGATSGVVYLPSLSAHTTAAAVSKPKKAASRKSPSKQTPAPAATSSKKKPPTTAKTAASAPLAKDDPLDHAGILFLKVLRSSAKPVKLDQVNNLMVRIDRNFKISETPHKRIPRLAASLAQRGEITVTGQGQSAAATLVGR